MLLAKDGGGLGVEDGGEWVGVEWAAVLLAAHLSRNIVQHSQPGRDVLIVLLLSPTGSSPLTGPQYIFSNPALHSHTPFFLNIT